MNYKVVAIKEGFWATNITSYTRRGGVAALVGGVVFSTGLNYQLPIAMIGGAVLSLFATAIPTMLDSRSIHNSWNKQAEKLLPLPIFLAILTVCYHENFTTATLFYTLLMGKIVGHQLADWLNEVKEKGSNYYLLNKMNEWRSRNIEKPNENNLVG